jgi:sulfur transfer protein SufE
MPDTRREPDRFLCISRGTDPDTREPIFGTTDAVIIDGVIALVVKRLGGRTALRLMRGGGEPEGGQR